METIPKIENISLNVQEKELYEKCLKHSPDMTIMAFKELRNNALSVKDPEAKKFYVVNGLLMEEKPDKDTINEMTTRNMN